VQWEVTFDIHPLFQERESQEDGDTDLWSETFHHLAAKSLIQDFEQLAERECEIEHGSGRRFQLSAVHTSKACNVISKYTAFVPVDLSTSSYLPTLVQYTHTGATSKQGNQRKQKSSGNRRHHGCSPGRSQSACGQNGDYGFYSMNAESSPSPSSTPSSSAWEHFHVPEAEMVLEGRVVVRMSTEVMDTFSSFHRLTLSKTMLLLRAAKGFMSKSPSRGSEATSEGDNESMDYLPLVSLQLACGAFLLNSAFCDAVNIPMEKLKWTSPFACHRLSLSPSGSCSTKSSSSSEHKGLNSSQQLLVPSGQGKGPSPGDTAQGAALEDTGRLRHLSGSAAESISRALRAQREPLSPAIAGRSFSSPARCRADSGRGWDTDGSELRALLSAVELQQQTEPEGMLWATAVALAWLEHSSASYFIEWELVAAKASLWLSRQRFPQGSSLAAVKAAAQQLFVLLRHWDENLEFNLLCYNPGSV
ncbi:VW5B1 protein, partial [Sylvia atricapilla]|nr:VW5B1 protein [Sylvia atricapilla]